MFLPPTRLQDTFPHRKERFLRWTNVFAFLVVIRASNMTICWRSLSVGLVSEHPGVLS